LISFKGFMHINQYAGVFLAIGLFDAGLLGAVCISLASSWAFGEVWGWASAGQEVTVAFAGQTKTAKAGADGRWVVHLESMAASAEGRDWWSAAAARR
jgi:hypothetical protein